MRALIILGLVIGTFFTAHSQQAFTSKSKKAVKQHKAAIKAFQNRDNQTAFELNQKALKSDPDFIEAHILNAELYKFSGKKLKAVSSLESAIRLNPNFFGGNFLDLGILYFETQQYGKSALILGDYIKQFRPKQAQKSRAEYYIECSKFAENALKNPVPFQPENLGENINSPLRDYNPVLDVTQKTLLFTRTIPDNSPSGAREDIYSSTKIGGHWAFARSVNGELNSEMREGAPSLSSDGKTMILTICEYLGDYGRNRKGLGSCDLFISYKRSGMWTNPSNLGPTFNTNKFDSQSSISANGDEIYFSSARSGGYGKSDIYVVKIVDGQPTAPQNLGPKINTIGKEEGVFIHPDNKTLYFTSTHGIGLGGSDIYMSKRDENGEWGEPINLGYPINTEKDEWGMTVDASATYGYFSSDREGGFGEMDIYKFPLPNSTKPLPVTYMKGKVFDRKSKIPINAKLELIDIETGKTILETYAKASTGEFLLCLPKGKNYMLNINERGYLFHSENFKLNEENSILKPLVKDVPLSRVETDGAPVVLRNVFFDTDKSILKPESQTELNKLATFLKENADIKIELSGHTDNQGSKERNLILSQERAKAVFDFLVKNQIKAERMQYKGYGDTQPIDDNTTVEGRKNNRRTEFKIIE